MYTGQLGAHRRVPKSLVNMDRVRAELWISNLNFEKKRKLGYKASKADYPGVLLYEEDGDHVILPRGYPVPWTPVALAFFAQHSCEDMRPVWESSPWEFLRTLKPKQVPASRALLKPGDKQLCMGCGKGKTTLALWCAAQRGVKTLIVVDRDFLVDQWSEEITNCLGIPREQIGVVQGQEREIGEQVTIAVINTLSQQEFDKEFFDAFGFVIVDECHMLGAPTFGVVLPNFTGERLLLSATPTRKDGMHPVFMYHGGGLRPCYTDLSREQSSRWFFLKLPRILSEEDETACFRRVPGLRRPNGRPVYAVNRPVYESKASRSLTFNQLIIDEVMKAARTGRSVLVLGSRVEQLTMLAEVTGEHYETGLVTGHVKGQERRDAFGKQVMFITDRIGNRALDVPRLDTLFLLYPTKDSDFLRQTVGRIDREFENKRSPLVVVFCHTLLEKGEDAMELAIREVDSRASIQRIRRAV